MTAGASDIFGGSELPQGDLERSPPGSADLQLQVADAKVKQRTGWLEHTGGAPTLVGRPIVTPVPEKQSCAVTEREWGRFIL